MDEQVSRERMLYCTGLLKLAEWVSAHPEIPLPSSGLSIYGLDTKEDAAKLVRSLGGCTKKYNNDFFYVEKEFDGITLQAVFYREKVCKKRVVGVETIPAHYIPAGTREICEWDCEPILEASQNEAGVSESSGCDDNQRLEVVPQEDGTGVHATLETPG